MLSKQLAQKVVDQIMKDVDYNINIMDETGTIIASGDNKRIGTIHQGAKKVMVSKERNFIYEDTLTEKKGINDPIFIDNKCVGVVGISGYPEEVLKIKNVVNTLFYFLIRRESEISEQFNKKEMRQDIIRKLIYHYSDLSYEETAFLRKRNIQSLENIVVCVVEGEIKKIPDEILFYRKSNHLVVLLLTENQIKQAGDLKKLLKPMFEVGFICGMAKTKERVNESYQQARATLYFMTLFKQNELIQSYENNKVFVDIVLNINSFDLTNDIYNKMFILHEDEMLLETLLVFIDNNSHMKHTAEKLIVHRNTVDYRLNKIKKITGYDPYTFKGLSNLVNSVILFSKYTQENSYDKN